MGKKRVIRTDAGAAKLRIRRRFLPAAAILPFLRWVSVTSLILAVLLGGFRYFLFPEQAGALEFTPRIIGTEGGAKGVLGIAVGDMDNDGDLDVVTGGEDGVKLYEQTSSGQFKQHIVEPIEAERVQLVDFDGDSQLDILAVIQLDPSIRWYRNEGNKDFAPANIGTGSEAKVYAGDLNGDGAPDIASATNDGGGVMGLRRWMNDGSGNFTATVLAADSGVTAVTIGDTNSNQFNDIVTSGSKGLQHWDTSDGITWNRVDIDEGKTNASHITVASVTSDSTADIILGEQHDDKVVIYRHIQHSSFERIELTGAADAVTVDTVDFDQDGDEDVIVAAQDNATVFWYENIGNDEYVQRTLATGIQSVFGLAVADIDNDNDLDFIAGDGGRGDLWWYERTRAKPVATAPTNIRQTTDGTGRVTFDTTISDTDRDPTRLRIQYSLDGDHWYKPWLLRVTTDNGSVDLKNSNAYQAGTNNPIDTDAHGSVKLTFLWDARSVDNTGGPITGDISSVRLRVIPYDGVGNGLAAVSSAFRIDNDAPAALSNFRVLTTSAEGVTLAWDPPSDSSAFTYRIYYGTDRTKVLDRKSDVWDAEDDEAMGDIDTDAATITDLQPGQTYIFKMIVKDAYGNETAVPSVTAVVREASATPVPTLPPDTTPSPTPLTSTTPLPSGSTETPVSTIVPTTEPSATPPPTSFQNKPPQADAGLDQIVNPSALVILDGSASFDEDGDSLNYTWRQISGPTVRLISDRTANPSFSAGGETETYIFSLTVRDPKGATSTDLVTVATKNLPDANQTPVEVTDRDQPPPVEVEEIEPVYITALRVLDYILLALAVISTLISLMERVYRSWKDKEKPLTGRSVFSASHADAPRGRVVHYRTNEAIAGVQVLVYGTDGKLRASERTNARGEFSTLFPPGEYTISVKTKDFTFSPAASAAIKPEHGILYSGGKITVQGSKPVSIVIPMKPVGKEISSSRTRVLHFWQALQHVGRVFSWPLFIAGALTNTALVFLAPSIWFLVIEILYVGLVIIKVAMEVRVRPAYGLVRDAITHVPLDLAVVRLFEQGTNKLVMTRVTNTQGKFFALPPSGTYTITVTKPGYAVFSKENVDIKTEQDSILQLTADLMPVAPQPGLMQARAAVL